MEDQVYNLRDRGIKCCFLNITGKQGFTYECDNEEEDINSTIQLPKSVSLQDI